ncbi:MAG: hypothetical protein GY929_14835 [Actinomycetia bacterium]|nr:hypothetical protein [Actinomycetes bacterium]
MLVSMVSPHPVAPEVLSDRFRDCSSGRIVADCATDGGQPFTAPAALEPRIPLAATLVVACIGSVAIGKVIADRCHHPLRVAAAAECSPYERLTPERAAAALTSERGLRKAVPTEARFVVAVANAHPDDRAAAELVDRCTDLGVDSHMVLGPSPQRSHRLFTRRAALPTV